MVCVVIVMASKFGRGRERKTGRFWGRGNRIRRLELVGHGYCDGKRAGSGLVQQGRWWLSNKNHGTAAIAKGCVRAVVWLFMLCPGFDTLLVAV